MQHCFRAPFISWKKAGLGLAIAAMLAGCAKEMAPQTNFVLLDGSTHSTESLRGKVALVNFWATSCVTCVAEMPDLVALHERHASQGYETLAVAMQYNPPAYVVNFAETRKLPFKVALDNTGSAAKAWGDIRATPTTFVLDRKGQIVKRYVGQPDMRDLNQLIESLLKEPA